MIAALMREHDPLPPDDTGRIRCRHCGAWLRDGIILTCFDRPDPNSPAPRPWRGSALDDNDAMAARIGELRRKQDEALARPAEPEPVAVADELDFSCGWRLL